MKRSLFCIQAVNPYLKKSQILLCYVLTFASNSHRKNVRAKTRFLLLEDQSKTHILKEKKMGVSHLVFSLQSFL